MLAFLHIFRETLTLPTFGSDYCVRLGEDAAFVVNSLTGVGSLILRSSLSDGEHSPTILTHGGHPRRLT